MGGYRTPTKPSSTSPGAPSRSSPSRFSPLAPATAASGFPSTPGSGSGSAGGAESEEANAPRCCSDLLLGIQLLCAVGCGREAALALADLGMWDDAAQVGKMCLGERDCRDVFRKWANHLNGLGLAKWTEHLSSLTSPDGYQRGNVHQRQQHGQGGHGHGQAQGAGAAGPQRRGYAREFMDKSIEVSLSIGDFDTALAKLLEQQQRGKRSAAAVAAEAGQRWEALTAADLALEGGDRPALFAAALLEAGLVCLDPETENEICHQKDTARLCEKAFLSLAKTAMSTLVEHYMTLLENMPQ